MTSAADWTYYQVGKIFDTRVEPPTCTGPDPPWLSSATFIQTNKNNPLLFCTGTDQKRPGQVQIKARVNRGFGFNATVSGTSASIENSTMDPKRRADILKVLGELDQAFAQSFLELTSDGNFVGPGQEVSVSLSEDSVRGAGTDPTLKLDQQALFPFILTLIGQLIGSYMTNQAEGYAAALLVTAKCANDIRSAKDAGTGLKATISCVGGLDDATAKNLALYLDKRGIKDAGKLARKLVGKASVYLALIGPVFNAMNYFAETHIGEEAHTVTLLPTAKPSTTKSATPAKVEVSNLAPVTSEGQLANGYIAVDAPVGADGVDCSYPSPAAVSDSVYYCGGTADGADACFPGDQANTVLCLRDPWGETVDRLPLIGVTLPKVAPPDRPIPIALRLSDGTRCRARNGGAWDIPVSHPKWVGYYSCGQDEAVWGPPDQDGIIRAVDTWMVWIGAYDGPLRKTTVTHAYYVSTAG